MTGLSVSQDGGVLTLQLNRPPANALDRNLCAALARTIRQCNADPSVRCVVITGKGRFFSAGGDLQAFQSAGDNIRNALAEMAADLHSAILALARMETPLVVAVNGAAAGAGVSLALFGDIVLAARSASFTSAYTAAGLTPDGGSTFLLPRLIGLRRAQEFMLLNQSIGSEMAAGWGMVSEVVDDADLAARTATLAAILARGPVNAFGATRRLLVQAQTFSLASQLDAEAASIADAAASLEGQEGIKAFLARRKPVFETIPRSPRRPAEDAGPASLGEDT